MNGQRSAKCLCANAQLLRSSIRSARTMEPLSRISHRTAPSRVAIRHQFNQAGPRPQGMDKLREAFKEHPILLPTGFACVFLSFCFLGYVNYVYLVQSKAMHHFPEPVAKQLRKAIYYDKGYGKDPKKAFQYYKEALLVATDLNMNPYSEEFQGMRIRMAEFLEENRQMVAAITVLEKEREYCYEFLERGMKAKADGIVEDVPDKQWSRIVGMAVKLGVKLGKLYSDEDIEEPEKAQAALIKAVETLLRERIRRQEEGIKEEAREFLNEEEVGAALEELGHTYLGSNQAEFALPLFLQALSLCPPKSCHAAMLMNQVSASLSLQNPATASALLDAPKGRSKAAGPSKTDLQAQAKQWAEKALAASQAVSPPDRTEECDIACAVTTHNMAELAHLSGDDVTAKKLFLEAKTLSKAMGFQDGVEEATAALIRLNTPKAV